MPWNDRSMKKTPLFRQGSFHTGNEEGEMKMLPKDPMILLSTVNTWLRDGYESLDALCEDKDIDRETLAATLAAVGFTYDPVQNRFR